MTNSASTSARFSETELERRLFDIYSDEVQKCDRNGQSTQHIGDEWMRREIRNICGFDVSDRWIKQFRRKYSIRYFSGRRHTSHEDQERRVLRTSRLEYEDVNSRVNAEIVRRQQNGERLTNPWIREYAQLVATQLYPTKPSIHSSFDSNWLYRFKRRYCVELKPRGPSQPEAPRNFAPQPTNFHQLVGQYHLVQNYFANHISNTYESTSNQ